jgi:hypothetical protein
MHAFARAIQDAIRQKACNLLGEVEGKTLCSSQTDDITGSW